MRTFNGLSVAVMRLEGHLVPIGRGRHVKINVKKKIYLIMNKSICIYSTKIILFIGKK